jgi:hypothetical protein
MRSSLVWIDFVGSGRHLEDDASMVVMKVREEVTLPSLSPPGSRVAS